MEVWEKCSGASPSCAWSACNCLGRPSSPCTLAEDDLIRMRRQMRLAAEEDDKKAQEQRRQERLQQWKRAREQQERHLAEAVREAEEAVAEAEAGVRRQGSASGVSAQQKRAQGRPGSARQAQVLDDSSSSDEDMPLSAGVQRLSGSKRKAPTAAAEGNKLRRAAVVISDSESGGCSLPPVQPAPSTPGARRKSCAGCRLPPHAVLPPPARLPRCGCRG